LFTVADLERDGRALLESVLNRLDDAAMGDLIKGLELLAGAADGVRDVEATAK
jgi:hypothetical protein